MPLSSCLQDRRSRIDISKVKDLLNIQRLHPHNLRKVISSVGKVMVEKEQARDPKNMGNSNGIHIYTDTMYTTYLFAYTMDYMFISCVMYGIYIFI